MPVLTRKRRHRSVDNILDEIELLHQNYAAERVYFEDSIFCVSKQWFEEFCEKYMARGLHEKVQWGFETRIDTVDLELFKIAKEAGCIYTFFGVESGSELVLRKANKNYGRDRILSSVSAAKEAGIAFVNISIIFGLPFETKGTVAETLDLLRILPFDGMSANILDVYPGTRVAEMLASGEGGLKWGDGRDLDWSGYSRSNVMVEMNDLSASDLLAAREAALGIAASRSNRRKKDRIFKLWAYSKELLLRDPGALFEHVKVAITGRR
jgi:radical SAM superfamily enzyme YgiQ (UPF0313 family)